MAVSADTYLGTDVFFTADLVAPIVIGTKDIHFSIGVSLGNLFSDSVKGQRVLAGNTEDMPLAA